MADLNATEEYIRRIVNAVLDERIEELRQDVEEAILASLEPAVHDKASVPE
jgi:uncharacterized lipoprotein YajG